MPTTTFSGICNLKLASALVDVIAQTLIFTIQFLDQSTGRPRGGRSYTVKPNLSVTDDAGNAMPAAQSALRDAVSNAGPNASLGVIGELNAYIATNASSFQP